MTTDTATAATRETYKDSTKTSTELVRLWLDALALADEEERTWRSEAKKAVELYRQSGEPEERIDRRKKFNILHSNIETILPALYNSTPAPDVRRRFNDDDPVAKTVSDIQERCISYSIDRYEFDHFMRLATSDMELAGRGVARIRYRPYLAEDDTLADEEVQCEPVGWKDFRRGPGKTWDEVPWIAFRHTLTREQLEKLSPELGSQVNLDIDVSNDKKDGKNASEVFKRAEVWEIWDKDRRKVLFIAKSFKEKPIREEDDPLELNGFFPTPRPLYAIQSSDSLVPVVPYEIYRAQAEELEEVSARILHLTRAVKARSIYDGRLASAMDRLEQADEADSIPEENVTLFADGSKLADHVMWMPIDMIVAALEKLYMARDQIKQVIYEVTGISDILRGASEAQETATAQSIKQQWGSLRIQHKQQEVQRFVRDIFRMKAELFASKFDPKTLEMMTGIPLMPTPQDQPEQAQQKMAVLQLLQSDRMRDFRVDIESDSTIRADMTRNQQNMNLFLQGTAQFAQAMAPIAMQEPGSLPVIMEVYTAFARNFKLGRQAENALDNLADQAKQSAQQPKPEDPQIQIEKMKAENEQQKMQAQMQADQAKMQMEAQFKQQEHQMKIEMMQADLQKKEMELQFKARELEMKERQMHLDAQMSQQQAALDAQSMEHKAALDARTAEIAATAAEQKHSLGIDMMRQKAKQQKKPQTERR